MKITAICAAAMALVLAGLACAKSSPTPVSTCPADYPVGYRVTALGGVKTAEWYPTASPEAAFAYSTDISSTLAKDGEPLTSCGPFPLVVFAHGLLGCGTQSIFFTETLARKGYVVLGPDYHDALLCHSDGIASGFSPSVQPAPILHPEAWTDASYSDRRDDTEKALEGALQDPALKPIIDANKIGIAGHSLGGYTALAMAGGWASWRDSRFKAALLLSPYSLPFSVSNTLAGVTVPLMYQGAELDVGITPFVEGPKGAYAQSNAPKYFVKLRAGNHFTWTNAVCAKVPLVADCVQSRPQARLIVTYGIAFFDLYLKGVAQPMLSAGNIELSAFERQP